MTQVSKPYTFVNGTTADANQVNQDFDTLYNVINGNIDSSNIADGSIQSADLATEAVTPTKTEGLPYAQDILAGPCVISGLAITKDGSIQNQIDVTAGVAYVKQSDGTLRRINVSSPLTFRTSSASATYYLDLNPDGTWSWQTGHSTQPNYLNLATVTSDGSGNVATVTTNAQAYQVVLIGAGSGVGAGNPNLW